MTPKSDLLSILVELSQSLAVFLVLFYLYCRSPLFRPLRTEWLRPQARLNLYLFFSAIAILAALPFMIPDMIGLKLTGEHYVFYLQPRVGKGGKDFLAFKFATMLKDSPNMAGGVLILLDMMSDTPEKPKHGFSLGTGMHGGTIFVRGGVDESRLSKEVGVFELTADDCAVLEEYLKDYCKDFGLKLKDVMKEKFVKILPKSKRPYGNMYCAMPR